MVRISRDVIDPAPLLCAVSHPEAGAIVSFHGIVRSESGGRRVLKMEYEANEEMAQVLLSDIEKEAQRAFPVTALAIQHRIGVLHIGETSVFIAVSSAHRADAFAACRYVIDRIKKTVPIWKKEYFSGDSRWVEGVPAV